MLSLSCLLSVFALTNLRVSAQSQGNETEVPFALQSPGRLVQCKNTTIVWQGGKAPYKVDLTPVCGGGKNASDETHTVFAPDSASVELLIHFAKDTALIVSITDSTNMQATAPQSIVASGDADNSCTLQTACTDSAQVPSAPDGVAGPTSQSTSSNYPTDGLVTTDPSATSASPQTPSMTGAYLSGSTVFVVYSYVSQTPTPSTTPESSLQGQANTAIPSSRCPGFAVVGPILLVGSTMTFGPW